MLTNTPTSGTKKNIKNNKQIVTDFLDTCKSGSASEVKAFFLPDTASYHAVFAVKYRGAWKAAQHANFAVLDYFYQELGLDPTYKNNMLIYAALASAKPEMIEYLFALPAFRTAPPVNEVVMACAYATEITILKSLIENPKYQIDLLKDNSAILSKALESGSMNIIQYLLDDCKMPMTEEFKIVLKEMTVQAEKDILLRSKIEQFNELVQVITLKNKLTENLKNKPESSLKKI